MLPVSLLLPRALSQQPDGTPSPGAEALNRTGAFVESLFGMGSATQSKILLSVAGVLVVWLDRKSVV